MPAARTNDGHSSSVTRSAKHGKRKAAVQARANCWIVRRYVSKQVYLSVLACLAALRAAFLGDPESDFLSYLFIVGALLAGSQCARSLFTVANSGFAARL